MAIFVFNRPEETRRLIAAIGEVQPRRLYVVADGPRTEMEENLTSEVRGLFNTLDWPCELHINASKINLGCRDRIKSGIDWVFESEEMAIFLEDDCLPTKDFFTFVSNGLKIWQHTPSVGMISGNNYSLIRNRLQKKTSLLSKHPHIWGWGTWRSVWNKFDPELGSWPTARQKSAAPATRA